MIQTSEKVYLRKYLFVLKAKETLLVPAYKGSMFRGAFGWAFRNVICITKLPVCDHCTIKKQCLYFNYFESELPSSDLPYLRGIKKTPHPFVIHPPLSNSEILREGYEFEVGLTLIGMASTHIPYFIYTFNKMCEDGFGVNRGKAILLAVKDITPGSEEKTIYSSEENRIKDSNPVFYPGTKFREIVSEKSGDIRKCTMTFTTPLRLQMLGKTLNKREEVTSKILIINLMRRCLSASYLFCEDEVPVEPVFNFENIRISSNSLQFFDWERYSSRQKTRMNMGGFLGSITLEGDISAALPFIYTGSFLNAGKNTLFGLGQYTTSFV